MADGDEKFELGHETLGAPGWGRYLAGWSLGFAGLGVAMYGVALAVWQLFHPGAVSEVLEAVGPTGLGACGMGAVIFALLALGRGRRRVWGGLLAIIFGLLLGLGEMGFCWVVMNSVMDGGRGIESTRAKCASNMRSIGQAILMYCNENRGKYPETLSDVMVAEDVDAWTFVCPDSNDTPATGATTQAVAANLVGSHLTYVYLGKGLTTGSATPDTVVLYEPLADHGDGMFVLFGDGHLEFVPRGAAEGLLKKIQDAGGPVEFK